MRRSLIVAALMCTTALTPAPAQAGWLTGFMAVIGGGAPLVGTGFLAGTSGFLGGAFAAQGAFGFLGSALGRIVLSVGLQLVANVLMPNPAGASPNDRLINVAQDLAPMEYALGRVRKGGPLAVTAFSGDTRHTAILLAAHSCDGVEQWFVDDTAVSVAANGEIEDEPWFKGSDPDPGDSAVSLRFHGGQPGQQADAQLLAGIAEWTAAHDMAGLTYAAMGARKVKPKRFSEVYGNSGEFGPVVTPLFRAADRVYDPRTDTHGWTDNAALVLAWIITEVLGGSVDWEHVKGEADRADESVTDRNGTVRARWRLNGAFESTADFERLRNEIIAATDGYIWERPDGSIGFMLGRYEAPQVTLTENDLLSLRVADRDWGPAPFTEFAGVYVEPDHDWREAPTAVWIADAEARQNRETVPLSWVADHNQAMRCLKRIAHASRPEASVEAVIGPTGYRLLQRADGGAHRFVRIDAFGSDMIVEIGQLSREADRHVFHLVGASVAPGDFDFDAATEEPPRPPRESTSSDDSVPAPASVSGVVADGGAIRWVWDAQPAALHQQIRIREAGDADWRATVTLTEGETEYLVTGLAAGASYEAELWNVTGGGRESERVVSDPVAFAVATGGTVDVITVDGQEWRVHTFTAPGTLQVAAGVEAEYLVIGGGGGGAGRRIGGGGGAGRVLKYVAGEGQNTGAVRLFLAPGKHTITVGTGGAGGINEDDARMGLPGAETRAFGLVAPGGGGGGGWNSDGAGLLALRDGGSGGGGAGESETAGVVTPGSALSGASGTRDGGAGIESAITGTAAFYGGGGGGAGSENNGDGDLGAGGSGVGGDAVAEAGQPGAAGTGSGGGASMGNSATHIGGAGGGGVVIIRYPLS